MHIPHAIALAATVTVFRYSLYKYVCIYNYCMYACIFIAYRGSFQALKTHKTLAYGI